MTSPVEKLFFSTNVRTIEALLPKAWEESPENTVKTIFHLRDIRNGGKGSRKFFVVGMKWLVQNHPEVVLKNMAQIGEIGCYRDYWEIFYPEKELRQNMLEYYANRIKDDLLLVDCDHTPSYAAKWAPSEKGSHDKKHSSVREFCKVLDMNRKEYRQVLVHLRKKIGILETKLCDRNYVSITPNDISFRSLNKYHRSLWQHVPDVYMSRLELRQSRQNVSARYPLDFVRGYRMNGCLYDATLELGWNSLILHCKFIAPWLANSVLVCESNPYTIESSALRFLLSRLCKEVYCISSNEKQLIDCKWDMMGSLHKLIRNVNYHMIQPEYNCGGTVLQNIRGIVAEHVICLDLRSCDGVVFPYNFIVWNTSGPIYESRPRHFSGYSRDLFELFLSRNEFTTADIVELGLRSVEGQVGI